MLIVSIILFIIAIILFCISFKISKNVHTINKEIDKENNNLNKLNETLKEENKHYQYQKEEILKQQNQEIQKLNELQEQNKNSINNFKDITNAAMGSYAETLEFAYNQKEIEFDEKINNLEKEFKISLSEIQDAKEKEEKILESIRATRAAAQQAQIKEKEIKENKEFYCLPLSVADRNDIQVLERVKTQLNKPRILSMLIWSTFFQKPMTALCNNVLGTKTIVGIYKITNQINNMCYIGQSVDISKRWKDHAKCGLGIDTPAGNKLYKAMIEEGIWNFSWELLEECPREELDEKEKFYIELYDSKNYGYNIKGNK